MVMNSASHEQRRPVVLTSLEDADGFRCVDIFARACGSFGFKEFRRDPEDAGRWTLIGDYSERSYATKDAAVSGAVALIPWLAEAIRTRSM
jgi:hypothetical protein